MASIISNTSLFLISGFNIKSLLFFFCKLLFSKCAFWLQSFLHATKSSQDYGQVINPYENRQNNHRQPKLQPGSVFHAPPPFFLLLGNIGTDLTLMEYLEVLSYREHNQPPVSWPDHAAGYMWHLWVRMSF